MNKLRWDLGGISLWPHHWNTDKIKSCLCSSLHHQQVSYQGFNVWSSLLDSWASLRQYLTLKKIFLFHYISWPWLDLEGWWDCADTKILVFRHQTFKSNQDKPENITLMPRFLPAITLPSSIKSSVSSEEEKLCWYFIYY